MSTEDQTEIQSLSTNGPSTVQLASITFQPTVQPTSTRIPLMARPTVSSGPPTVQPTLTSGPLTVQAQPLLANSQCQPLGLSFRFCSGDVAAIIGAVLFICYVVWGIPATIRFYKHVRGRLAARRQRQLAMPQDLERNLQGARPSDGEATSSSATLQGRDFAQSCPPLDDKIESALDQQRLNNFRYPASDSQVSIARSIQTVPRSPTQEFYSAPATPVPAYDEPSSQSSSPTTLPVADEEKCKDKVVVECHNSGAPPPASVDQPFGRIRALCQPYMW